MDDDVMTSPEVSDEESIMPPRKPAEDLPQQKYMLVFYEPGKLGPGNQFEFFVNRLGFFQTERVPETPFFSVSVTNGSGERLDVDIRRDDYQIDNYNCSIQVADIGIHTIQVDLDPGQDYIICGNPTKVMVTKKFAKAFGKTTSDPEFSTSVHTDPEDDPTSPMCKLEPMDVCQKPWGIAANRYTQEIYVADRESHQICCYQYRNKSLVLRSRFGQAGTEPGCLNRPTGIAMDPINDRLVITDKDNHRVSIFRTDGKFIMTFGKHGSDDGEFQFPWGVAVSRNGNYIAIADYDNHRIQLFNSHGDFLRKFSPPMPLSPKAPRFAPRGIVFDKTGTMLYISDYRIGEIFKLDVGMTEMTTLSTRKFVKCFEGICLTATGNIAVCDTKKKCVIVMSPVNGTVVSIIRQIRGVMLERPICVTPCFWGFTCVVEEDGKFHLANTI